MFVLLCLLLVVGYSEVSANEEAIVSNGNVDVAKVQQELGAEDTAKPITEILNEFAEHSPYESRKSDIDFPSRDESELLHRKDNFVSNFLRMLGLDENNLGNLAMNLLIYMGELLARSLIGDEEVKNEIPQYRSLVKEQGIMSGLSALVSASTTRSRAVKSALLDPTLPQDLIDGLNNRTGSSTSCVQLFLCRISPLIWGVQDTTKKEDSSSSFSYGRSLDQNLRTWVDNAWEGLPEREEVAKFGKTCDERFPECALIDFDKLF